MVEAPDAKKPAEDNAATKTDDPKEETDAPVDAVKVDILEEDDDFEEFNDEGK